MAEKKEPIAKAKSAKTITVNDLATKLKIEPKRLRVSM